MKRILFLLAFVCSFDHLSSHEPETLPPDYTEIIPTEIFCQIFGYLDQDDLISLTTVCKTFRSIVCDKTLLGVRTPVSIIPRQGGILTIPSFYDTVQILGNTLPQSLETWGQYPHLTNLSIATTSELLSYTQVIPHFPNLQSLFIQTSQQHAPSSQKTDKGLIIETHGFSFPNKLPFPIAQLTAVLFQNNLELTLPRLKTLQPTILLETAFMLDLAATKIWRLVGCNNTPSNPEDVSYILMMVTAPCGERSESILMARLQIMRMISGKDILSFRTWGIFDSIKTVLKYGKKNKAVLGQLISTLSAISPPLRVNFIRCLSHLATTPKKLQDLLHLINSTWMTDPLKSFIAMKMAEFILSQNSNDLTQSKRKSYTSALRSYVLALKSQDKKQAILAQLEK